MLPQIPQFGMPQRRGQRQQTRRRRRAPQGNAYGFHGVRPPSFQGGPSSEPSTPSRSPITMPGGTPGPIRQPAPAPAPSPVGIPGGAPGPTVQGGGTPGANPNTLTGMQGHDPLSKQRYWAAQGWLLRNNGEGFRYAGDDALQRYLASTGVGGRGPGDGRPNPGGGGPGGIPGGGGPGPVIGPGGGAGAGGGAIPGGGGPGPTPGPGGIDPLSGLPLDPTFEAQRRLLDDALAGRLGALAPLRAQIAAQQQLQGTRLDTNEGVDRGRLLDQMAARGIVGSGIQREDTGRLGTDYLRQRQDLANAAAGQYADLSRAEGEYRNEYSTGLSELLLALAGRQLEDPYAVTPAPERPRDRNQPRRRDRRRNR